MTQSSTCPGSLVANVSTPTRTLSFGGNHLNDLAPPSDIGGKSCHLVRHLPQLRLGRLGEVGNYRRIDQVGLARWRPRSAKARYRGPEGARLRGTLNAGKFNH